MKTNHQPSSAHHYEQGNHGQNLAMQASHSRLQRATHAELLPYARREDFKVARASELQGKERVLYRILEILPGFLAWSSLIGIILASIYAPFFAAYFIIAFSIYWLLKTIFLSYHVRYNYRRLKHHLELDWRHLISRFQYEQYYHLVVLPFYKEPTEVIDETLGSIAATEYDNQKILIVLAAEERAGEAAQERAAEMKEKWQDTFGAFLVTTHPAAISGEIAGKGSNVHWALEQARVTILDERQIPYRHVLTSVFDIDTVMYPHYFNCLIWHFLTVEQPYQSAYMPVPLFTNNLWYAPAISRVIAMSSTFWEMIMQERPDRAATFSSHSVPFWSLYQIGYGQHNVVSEDSRIFHNLFIANNGNFEVVPMAYPVKMDATVGSSLWGTIKNIYRQHRRWTYGVENWCYITYHFIKNREIPLRKRIVTSLLSFEGYWSLVTNPIMLFVLGWAPIYLGTREFHETVLSYELPLVVRNLLIIAMGGLVVSSIISLALTPPRPDGHSRFRYIVMALQWIMVPMTMIVFSAIPGLDAQTRLMFGRYMGFWVTPKSRESNG